MADPYLNYLVEADRPRWYCLQSRTTGKLILEDLDEHGDPVGSVLVYWDRAEAEAAAVAHRQTYPGWLIEVVPLPDRPPAVVKPKPRDLHRIVSVQLSMSLRGERVQIELRPDTRTEDHRLIELLGNALKIVATAEPDARIGPPVFIKLGPQSKQAESIDKVA